MSQDQGHAASPTPPRKSTIDADADAEDLVEALAERYWSQLHAGDEPDRAALLAAHPDIADELNLRLGVMEMMYDQGPGRLIRKIQIPDLDEFLADQVVPEQIGPYRILEPLGQGGMGAVYLAEQTEPVRRQVALKLIQFGLDTEEVISRFESERQALAMMSHPSIAKVLDAGTAEDGRPYFVMELVEGIPVTEFCDARRLGLADRLELFRQVCDAVHHAHQKGIIHRDLKPSNILVTEIDGRAAPKVIDFGIAKAISQRLVEATAFTQQGQIIGTPEYMSPEQARGEAFDVDTRSDVYSLGVVLYELLVGLLPFDARKLREKGFLALRAEILEKETTRPSRRLAAFGQRGKKLAELRGLRTKDLVRAVEGDLDWIVLKAMELDRDRRYPTVADLADDLGRHLSHDPVLAGPPGAAYRLGKFVRKHRLGVVLSAILATTLLIALVASIGLAVEARGALESAEAENINSLAAQTFFQDALSMPNPWINGDGSRDLQMEALLRMWESERPFDGKPPRTRATLHQSAGRVYLALTMWENAAGHLEQALETRHTLMGPAHQETLASSEALAIAYLGLGRKADVESLCASLLEHRTRSKEDDPAAWIDAVALRCRLLREQDEPSKAKSLLQEALAFAESRLGPGHQKTLALMDRLAVVLGELGARYEEIDRRSTLVRLAEESEAVPSWKLAYFQGELGAALAAVKRPDEAEKWLTEAHASLHETLGPENRYTMRVAGHAAALYEAWGKPDEAEKYRPRQDDPNAPEGGAEPGGESDDR